jgi:hypothetical protein
MGRRKALLVIEYDSDHGWAPNAEQWEFKLSKGHEYRPPVHDFKVEVVEDKAC